LQVEHPVSEWITGLDLVEQQIRVARNEALSFNQEDLKINGHAIELRICAEDPLNNFLPSVGNLSRYRPPFDMENVRVDDGYTEGMDIPLFYDPMIAKLIAFGKTREEASQRLIEAIDKYEIEGVATTLPFGKFVLQHEAFITGKFDTNFVKLYFSPEKLLPSDEFEIAAHLALNLYLEHKQELVVLDSVATNWTGK
jgi:propionyl-CoA carboxylase alpha chain